MKQVKCDLEKKMQDLGKRVKKNKIRNEETGKENKKICIKEKICPFMSTPDEEIACTPQCKIHRADKKGFECIFSELVPISFNASRIRNYIKEYLGLKN